jgi:hypothetical protein
MTDARTGRRWLIIDRARPPPRYCVIFAVARTVGWVAQWREMASESTQKITRPRQVGMDWVEIVCAVDCMRRQKAAGQVQPMSTQNTLAGPHVTTPNPQTPPKTNLPDVHGRPGARFRPDQPPRRAAGRRGGAAGGDGGVRGPHVPADGFGKGDAVGGVVHGWGAVC